jgi:hypothetical protein
MHRFAYFLLAEPSVLSAVRDETCRVFPEHVTLRGRFLASRRRISDLIAAGRDALRDFAAISAPLVGPASPDGTMTWYEVAPSDESARRIRAAHERLNQMLSGLDVLSMDEVAAYSGSHYRPHFTVSFARGQSALAHAPSIANVALSEWGLFRYSGGREPSEVVCIYAEALRPAGP